jgi:hypothetical protein
LIESFTKYHDVSHKVFKLVEPLLNDFFCLALDQRRAKHIHDGVDQALLLLGLQLLRLMLLLIPCRLILLWLELQFDILQSSCSDWEAELALVILLLTFSRLNLLL